MKVLLAVVLVGALVGAQDQTTPKQLSWKERAKLDYQRRYDKYILHKKAEEENSIATDSGSEINAIPLGTRIGTPPPPPPPPPPTPRPTTARPLPPPPPPTRPPPPPTTRPPPPPPPPTRPPPPPTTRPPPPPPPSTTRPPPPPAPPSTTPFRPPPPPPPPPSTTPYRPPPPPPTTPRPPPPPPPPPAPTAAYQPPPPWPQPTTRRAEAADATPTLLGVRGSFPSAVDANSASASSGAASADGQQGTQSGTFQTRPGVFPVSPNGGGFASSSATSYSSGGVVGGSSSSNAGTFNAGGQAIGTFTISTGGGSSASASTTGAVNKSPVALLGKVVQGIVRPITSILPAPLGPRGSNPGLVGGLVSGIFEELDGGIRAIYPGTLWCGAGNLARSDDEVGVFRSTDKCCRQHDNCPNSIVAGASKYGLRNTGTFTRSHCDCDEAFYNCLKADRKSFVSVKVGTTYFNLLRPRCFRAINPCAGNSAASNCTASYRWFSNRLF